MFAAPAGEEFMYPLVAVAAFLPLTVFILILPTK